MRILQLGKFYPIRGGVEKVMWDLTAGLSARGIECDMLCAMLRQDPVDAEHAGRCRETPEGRVIALGTCGRVICVPALAKKAATMIAPAMVRYLRRHAAEYDLIHIHHPDPMAALALRLSGYRGRVILHWHSDILSQKVLLFFYRPLQSWLLRRAERIVGTTPVYLAESPDLQDVRDKTVCVPIGIDPVRCDPRAAQAFRDCFPGRKIVLGMGRLVPYKGFGTLIEAARLLGPEYQVLIGGAGPLYPDLQRQVRDLGLEGRVMLLGYVQNWLLPVLFGACDVYVMSSDRKTEAFGITQIEAMSCGKPVVATRIPHSGVSWVNADGVSGCNVPPNDPQELAHAIRKICENENNYRIFAKLARGRFETLFTAQEMINKTVRVYEKTA